MLMFGILFLPSPAGIIDLDLSGITHDNNLVAESLFALFNEDGKLVTDPVHLWGWG